jgi:LysM repeat protein
MNRRQLAFVLLLNAMISLAIALGVAWAIEARRPDPEELAVRYTPAANLQPAPVAPLPSVSPPTSTASLSDTAGPAPVATTVPSTTTTGPTLTGEEEVYVVQAGDSLGAIASRFGLSVEELVAANELDNPDFVFSGQRLVIPNKNATPNLENNSATATPAASVASGQGLRIGLVETPGTLLSEAVSLINDSNLAVNLQGWRLEREGGPSYTFGSVSVFPGGSLWVHSRAGTNTSVALFWNQSAPVWQSGAVARLINPQGEVITSYTLP